MKKHIFLTYMLLNVVFLVQGQDDFSSSVIAHNNIKIAEAYITGRFYRFVFDHQKIL